MSLCYGSKLYFDEQSDGKPQIPSPIWVGGSQKCPVPGAELSPWLPAAPLLLASTKPTPRTSYTHDDLAKFQPLLIEKCMYNVVVHTGVDDVAPCC